MIRTVLGDISPAALGICSAHEHLLGRPHDPAADEDLCLTDERAAAAELAGFFAAGGRALVEMSPADYGRDAAGMVTFNFSEFYVAGQAGFAVLDIDATKGNLSGTGLIKIEEMQTNEATVYLE